MHCCYHADQVGFQAYAFVKGANIEKDDRSDDSGGEEVSDEEVERDVIEAKAQKDFSKSHKPPRQTTS